jgi:transcriptional regulator with XRE-family HTH domain
LPTVLYMTAPCARWANYVPVKGAEVRQRRVRLGMTVEELAAAIGVKKPWVSRIETAPAEAPRRVSPKVYNRLLDALGVTKYEVLRAPSRPIRGRAA